jgi:DNA-binding transcriptional regulator YhcF (GntR family)
MVQVFIETGSDIDKYVRKLAEERQTSVLNIINSTFRQLKEEGYVVDSSRINPEFIDCVIKQLQNIYNGIKKK